MLAIDKMMVFPRNIKNTVNLMNRIEKLAIIEQNIKLLEEHGYGDVLIRIKDGQICHIRASMDTNLPKTEEDLTGVVIVVQ
jgi:hypothetical protein